MQTINTGLYSYKFTGLPSDTLASLTALYPNSIDKSSVMADYQIDVVKTSLLRTVLRPQVAIKIDGQQPFNPISPSKLLPSIEWAMNWCVAAYDHTHLLIHCSVVEKNGHVILFPAKSGSGKSTTSSFLALNGWNMFYDEMAVINLTTGEIQPVFRPTSLKNNSIDIIRPYINDVNQGYMSHTTSQSHKGDLAHLRSMARAKFDQLKPTRPSSIVFLNYKSFLDLNIYEVDQSIGFSKLIANAFNYSVIGEAAFDVLTSIVGDTRIFEVDYSDLTSLTAFLEELVNE
jgi:HprK-related kinase A